LRIILLDNGMDRDEGDDEEDYQIHLSDVSIQRFSRLYTNQHTVMAAWFIAQPLLAKKMYMMMIMANEAVYMPNVDPIRRVRHTRES